MRCCLLAAAFIGLGSAFASAQSPVVGGWAIAPFFDAARTERVDVVCLGDSNQLHFAGGWDAGLMVAWSERFGLYATGVHTPGEGAGSGQSVGDSWNTIPAAAGGFQCTGAAPVVAEWLNAQASGLEPLGYISLAEGMSQPGSARTGLLVVDPARFPMTRALRFHFNYLVFESDGGLTQGQFQPVVRNDSGPIDFLVAEGSVYSTRSGPGTGVTLAWGVLDVPPGERPPRMSFQYSHPRRGVIGPFASFGMRLEGAEITSGAAIHTLYGKGGQSLRDMAEALQMTSDRALTTYFTMVRRLGSSAAMVRINSGLNDRNETLPSRGPVPTLPGNSVAAYEDNLQAIVGRLEEIYRLNGWDVEDLAFVLTPSHPISLPDDGVLLGYRNAATAFARRTPRAASVDLGAIVDAPTMTANRWYFTTFDQNHLSMAGYAALARRELAALEAAARCAADIDGSGGVDADDVVDFFQRWDLNAMDYSHDGATDGDDLIAYFADWDRGCK